MEPMRGPRIGKYLHGGAPLRMRNEMERKQRFVLVTGMSGGGSEGYLFVRKCNVERKTAIFIFIFRSLLVYLSSYIFTFI